MFFVKSFGIEKTQETYNNYIITLISLLCNFSIDETNHPKILNLKKKSVSDSNFGINELFCFIISKKYPEYAGIFMPHPSGITEHILWNHDRDLKCFAIISNNVSEYKVFYDYRDV
jgi:hypothetical protein